MEVNVLIEEGLEGCPDAEWLQEVMQDVLKAQTADPNTEMSLVITGQERIRELNRTYRDINEPTDVLSFFMTGPGSEEAESTPFVLPPDGMLHLGEVVISCPQAAVQAQEHGHSIKKEIVVLITHGVLHLLGYDHADPDQEKEMRARESVILEKLAPRFEQPA